MNIKDLFRLREIQLPEDPPDPEPPEPPEMIVYGGWLAAWFPSDEALFNPDGSTNPIGGIQGQSLAATIRKLNARLMGR